MEWCDHCLVYQQTLVERVAETSPKNFNGSCSQCGKILWDMTIGFYQQIRNKSKRFKRMKRVRKAEDNRKVKKCVIVDSMDEEDSSMEEDEEEEEEVEEDENGNFFVKKKKEDRSIHSDIN